MSGHTEIRYLTTAEAAAMLSVGVRTMERWRSTGAGPPVRWIRAAGGRLLPRYRSDDLHEWAGGRRRREAGPGGPGVRERER